MAGEKAKAIAGCPTGPGPPPFPSATLRYVVWSQDARITQSVIVDVTPVMDGYSFGFQARYDRPPGHYRLTALTDFDFYIDSTSFQISRESIRYAYHVHYDLFPVVLGDTDGPSEVREFPHIACRVGQLY